MKESSLNMLIINRKGQVKYINKECLIKRRLFDLGITEGTIIEKVLENISKNMCAYFIRGTLIAIRNEDAENIIIEVM